MGKGDRCPRHDRPRPCSRCGWGGKRPGFGGSRRRLDGGRRTSLYVHPATLADLDYYRRRYGLRSTSEAIRHAFAARGFSVARGAVVGAPDEPGGAVQVYLDGPTRARVEFYRRAHGVSASAAVREVVASAVALDDALDAQGST